MKHTKSSLIKLLKAKNPTIVLSRVQRNDINELINLCKQQNIDLQTVTTPTKQNIKQTKQTNNQTDDQDDDQDEDLMAKGAPVPNDIDTEGGEGGDVIDESSSMFERMKASIVDNVPRGTNDNVSSDSSFSVDIDETVQPKKKRGRKTKDPLNGFNLDGYLLLFIMDMALPTGISYIFNMFEKNPNKKIKGYEIALTDEQKEKLSPLADAVAAQLTFKMSPMTGFFIMSGLMYGNNLIMLQSTKQ